MAVPLPPDLARPRSLLEFTRCFAANEACAEYLFKVRWPSGFVCPKCGTARGWPRKRRPVIECANGHQISVTTDTTMHRTKEPLRTWFYAAYLVSTLTPGISALQFQRQLGIKRYETAFNMLHKLRSALVAPGREKLKGEVEVDESYVGGVEPGNSGREPGKKALVVVGVEIVRWLDTSGKKPGQHAVQCDAEGPPEEHIRDHGEEGVWCKRAGRVRMTVIPNAGAETLLPWVERNVENGATVYTDGWQGYNGLAELGYTHKRVLQSHKGHKTGRWLPLVHLLISNLKRWLVGTHKGAVLPKHLQAYLNEFTFRFNRRFWRGPAFLRALGLAMHADKRPEYETLYRAGEKGGWVHPDHDQPRNVGTRREQPESTG